jgi:hypothetical protein
MNQCGRKPLACFLYPCLLTEGLVFGCFTAPWKLARLSLLLSRSGDHSGGYCCIPASPVPFTKQWSSRRWIWLAKEHSAATASWKKMFDVWNITQLVVLYLPPSNKFWAKQTYSPSQSSINDDIENDGADYFVVVPKRIH